jgi:DNA-binding MarR family transcriptional regulator
MDTPNFDQIDPSQCINAKLRKLHRLINQAYQTKINPFGLRGSMLSILFLIGKKDEVDQKTLAHILVLDQSTISRDLRKLKDQGLIADQIGEDARQKLLSLTDKGKTLVEEISPIWSALHVKVVTLLGVFNVHQIDLLIKAIDDSLIELKS